MIKPCGHRLVVKAYKHAEVDEVKKKHQDFLKTLTVVGTETRDDVSVDRGVVIDIGPTAWKDFHGTPWCKKGDEIIFAKFAGKFVKDTDNEDYCILNDEDVIAVTKEA
jgi:co-chaperonin GroES (HSP10)